MPGACSPVPDPLWTLSSTELASLAADLRGGRMRSAVVDRVVEELCGSRAPAVVVRLKELATTGVPPAGIAAVLDVIRCEIETRLAAPPYELVLSGPDVPGVPSRDTEAVMTSLIEAARSSILMVGYAIWNGRRLFVRLAERMDADPALEVTFFLNIKRGEKRDPGPRIVEDFAAEFRALHWPGRRLPTVYYDPRSLDFVPSERAQLHAKCVVVDGSETLITSANFTEAAQRRNIEVGALFRDIVTARRISGHFSALVACGVLLRLPLD